MFANPYRDYKRNFKWASISGVACPNCYFKASTLSYKEEDIVVFLSEKVLNFLYIKGNIIWK